MTEQSAPRSALVEFLEQQQRQQYQHQHERQSSPAYSTLLNKMMMSSNSRQALSTTLRGGGHESGARDGVAMASLSGSDQPAAAGYQIHFPPFQAHQPPQQVVVAANQGPHCNYFIPAAVSAAAVPDQAAANQFDVGASSPSTAAFASFLHHPQQQQQPQPQYNPVLPFMGNPGPQLQHQHPHHHDHVLAAAAPVPPRATAMAAEVGVEVVDMTRASNSSSANVAEEASPRSHSSSPPQPPPPPRTSPPKKPKAAKKKKKRRRTEVSVVSTSSSSPSAASASPSLPPAAAALQKEINASSLRFRSYQADNWTEKYEELLEYRLKHGHCMVPNACPENPSLAEWVKRQRYQMKLRNLNHHSTMSNDRVEALKLLGFIWNSHDAVWEERWKQLCEYKAEHGDCNIPSKYPPNPRLAIWIKRQRRQFKFFHDGSQPSTLNKYRIDKLNLLGFAWNGRANVGSIAAAKKRKAERSAMAAAAAKKQKRKAERSASAAAANKPKSMAKANASSAKKPKSMAKANAKTPSSAAAKK